MKLRQNARLHALENSAERTARGMLSDPKIKVVVGSIACWNHREHTMTVPGWSFEPDDVRLVNAWRGLLDHECGHAELTDGKIIDRFVEQWAEEFGDQGAARVFEIANVLEDIRIEKEWVKRWPGSKWHFDDKNSYLQDQLTLNSLDPHWVPPNSKPLGHLGALLCTMLWLGRDQIETSDVHPEVAPLLVMTWAAYQAGLAAKSTIEVVHAAEDIWRALQPPPQPQEQPDDGEGEGAGGQQAPGADGGGDEGDPGDGEAPPGSGDQPPAPPPQVGEDQGTPQGGQAPDAEGAGVPEAGDPPASGREPAPAGSHRQSDPSGGEEAEASPPDERREVDDTPFHSSPADTELVANVIGGDWNQIPTDMEVIGNAYIGDRIPPYTVHPDSKARDKLTTFGAEERRQGREKIGLLMQTAGPAAQKLVNLMRSAIQASRQTMTIGEQEEGDDLDDDMIGLIAQGLNGPGVFTNTFRHVEESTGIWVQVDCSGSMGSSAAVLTCPHHGRQYSTICKKCGSLCRKQIMDKAGYAAVTATALHRALRAMKVPHAVSGYTTHRGIGVDPQYRREAPGYLVWSRASEALHHYMFVPPPGYADDGSALAYINGNSGNCDGESVLWAAQQAAREFGHLDRVILVVIADGLPTGTDDYQMTGPNLVNTVERIARAGIEVYGVGVGIRHMATFRSFYPDVEERAGRAPTGCIEIPSGQGLTDAVLRKLTNLVTRGYGQSRRVKQV